MNNQKNDLKEGETVIIADKLDERIRKDDESIHIGTLIKKDQNTVWVLLKDGNIWIGDIRKVFLEESDQIEDDINED